MRTLHNDLNVIFNYAVRMHDLAANPVRKVGSFGKAEADEMKFWDPEQCAAFARCVMQEPLAYYAFETLYWCGLCQGECFALWHDDPQFQTAKLPIYKSLQMIKGREVITDPKAPQSTRDVSMPERYAYELMQCQAMCYGSAPKDRIFLTNKNFLCSRMLKYAAEAGLELIRVHDLRHSHVSLLIELGFTVVDIGKRAGQKSIDITLRYAHMFPSKQNEMASKLDGVMGVAVGPTCPALAIPDVARGPEALPTDDPVMADKLDSIRGGVL